MSEYAFTDRYGGNPPDPKTMCNGQCEGIGLYPVPLTAINEEACLQVGGTITVVGQIEEDGRPSEDDGYAWVRCPDCGGSGLKEKP